MKVLLSERGIALVKGFWSLLIHASKFGSKKHRKTCENRGYWPPKTVPKSVQNAFKIDVPQNKPFFLDFLLIFVVFGFVRLCCEVLKT